MRTALLELDGLCDLPAESYPKLIIAQLHVAFLRAHDELVDELNRPNRFGEAKKRLRQHYQHVVVQDFLKQIADKQIADETIESNKVYDPDEDEFFMPLEFSVAALARRGEGRRAIEPLARNQTPSRSDSRRRSKRRDENRF